MLHREPPKLLNVLRFYDLTVFRIGAR